MPAIRTPMSIATKFRIVIGLLAAILVGICSIVIVQVHGTRIDLRRVAEERREADLARAVVLDIDGFKRWVELRTKAPSTVNAETVQRDQLAHIDGALAAFGAMARQPGDDPSRLPHQQQEATQSGRLLSLLQAARAAVAAGGGVGAQWVQHAEQMRTLADAMCNEMAREAHTAVLDLEQRSDRAQRFVTVLAAAALLMLLGVCMFVVRGIVQPLRELSAGTRAIGRGQRQADLPARGGAEVVDLSREITAMADQLETQQRELQQRVEQRTLELVRSARLADLGAVAAGLAHEINNPLASIVACADGLQARLGRGTGTLAEHREDLRTIAEEAERVREITTRLLEIARPSSDELGPVDVASAVHAVVTLVRHRFAQAGVTVRVECPPDLPPVHSNQQELRQILLNLLSNALDASPARGTVAVRVHRQGSEILLDVDDAGAGVPPELLDRIFDPFFSTKRHGQGTGLGLSIVQRILERHGGHVEVMPLQPGARFRVRLPIAAE